MTCASTEHRGPCSWSLSVLTIPTMLSSFFFFLFVLLLRGFLSLLCELAIHFAVSSFSPHVQDLAPSPYPIFFISPLRRERPLALRLMCRIRRRGSRLCFTYNSVVFSVWPHRHCQFRPCRGIVLDFRIVTVLLALSFSSLSSDKMNLLVH